MQIVPSIHNIVYIVLINKRKVRLKIIFVKINLKNSEKNNNRIFPLYIATAIGKKSCLFGHFYLANTFRASLKVQNLLLTSDFWPRHHVPIHQNRVDPKNHTGPSLSLTGQQPRTSDLYSGQGGFIGKDP